jgi:hypothetical protein
MNRVEFTGAKTKLLQTMIDEGEQPLEDYLKRSNEEQNRLFKLGLSKCDGYKITSGHQRGKAEDIYFQDKVTGLVFDKNGEAISPVKGWEYWHKKAEELGFKPMIEWDKGHFEG